MEMGRKVAILIIFASCCCLPLAGGFFTNFMPALPTHGEQKWHGANVPGNRHLPLISSLRAAWSSDENRREEQRKILLGKRVAVAAQLDSKTAWNLLPVEVSQKYLVKRELGRGAFGCVLLAEDRETGDRVAIKICRPQRGEMAIVMREGLAMMRIKSEHVAQLIEMGCSTSDQEVAWFVIEFLEGSNLNDVLVQRGPLPVKEACKVGLDVLQGLSDVHDAGLVHRDVKPQNVVRVKAKDGGWKYKMIDLGSATASVMPMFEFPGKLSAAVDKTGKREFSAQDVGTCLKALDIDAGEDDIRRLIKKHDKDGDGFITKEEFGAMSKELSARPYAAFTLDEREWQTLKHVFASLDEDKDGMLSMSELQTAFAMLLRQPSNDELHLLMAKYDSNGDDHIDRDEFRLMYGELVALQDSMNLQGTHGYMPPELYNKAPLSPASDVWSVGAMLFRLVSGQLPFTVSGGTWGQAMVGDLNVKAPRLKHLVMNVNTAFEEIVDRALRKHMGERFKTAAEMREQLQLVYQQLP